MMDEMQKIVVAALKKTDWKEKKWMKDVFFFFNFSHK